MALTFKNQVKYFRYKIDMKNKLLKIMNYINVNVKTFSIGIEDEIILFFIIILKAIIIFSVLFICIVLVREHSH